MSSASPFRRSTPDHVPARQVQWLKSLVVDPARVASFWAAIAIPFVLLGLVFTGTMFEQESTFAGLVFANLLALRVGHAHKRD